MPDAINSPRRERDYSGDDCDDCDDKSGVCGATSPKKPEASSPKPTGSCEKDNEFHAPCLADSYSGVSANEVVKNMTASKPLPTPVSKQTNASQTPESELKQVNARLDQLADYAGRAGDLQRKGELEKLVADGSRKTPAPSPECTSDNTEACPPILVPDYFPEGALVEDSGPLLGDREYGFAHSMHSDGHVEYTIGVAQQKNEATVGGVHLSESMQGLTTHEALTVGGQNPDGSHGYGFSTSTAIGSAEATIAWANRSVTLGLSAGGGVELSGGTREAKRAGEPDVACARLGVGPLTLGACLPEVKR